jgi:hypothetical protein
MSGSEKSESSVGDETLKQIRERVLTAEKDKLDLDLARGINNEIEDIIREEVD